ncbi:MAG: hypothetical protein VX466_06630 [Myxococcota bacterium]|nr:hypothetical protein [Myxococcota bacterium]
MPRELADVLHHFIPESGPADSHRDSARSRRDLGEATLPIVGVPVGERDVVRAAFTWNLAVEVARAGGRATVVAPATDANSALWPEESTGPLGANVVLAPATNLGQLYRAALDVADTRSSRGPALDQDGLVFVRVPPLWLRNPQGATGLLRWTLLFTSSENRDLIESFGIAKLLTQALPNARIGVTVHGTRRMGDAEAAFSRLERATSQRLGLALASYGLLVDDLHIYQAIVAQRPIGMVHPQSPAARSMGDVANLLLEEARNQMSRADA